MNKKVLAISVTLIILALPVATVSAQDDYAHVKRTTTYVIDNDGGVLSTNEVVTRANVYLEKYVRYWRVPPDFSALKVWGADKCYPGEPENVSGKIYNTVYLENYNLDPGEEITWGVEYYTYSFTTLTGNTWTLDFAPGGAKTLEYMVVTVKLPPYATASSVSPTPYGSWMEGQRWVYKFEGYNVLQIHVQISYTINPPAASLQITAESPVNILVTSPRERRVGYDPATGGSFLEIPGAFYSGPDTEPQEIRIPDPTDGLYLIDVFGTGNGPYKITVNSLNSEGTVISSQIITGVAVTNGHYMYSSQIAANGHLTCVSARVELCPNILNFKCNIGWIIAYIEFPKGFKAADVDASTILLAGAIPAERVIKIPFCRSIMVTFNGNALRALLAGQSGCTTLTVTGNFVDGTPFAGSDTIRIVKTQKP